MRAMMTVGFMLVAAGVAGAQGEVPWEKDPAAAMLKAKETGRPMMLYFTSEG